MISKIDLSDDLERVENEEREERQFREVFEQTSESNLRDLSEVRSGPFMNFVHTY